MPKTRGQTAIENRSSDSDEEFTDTRVAGTAADDNMAAASPTTTDQRDTNMITMTEDQLSRILASVMRGSTQPPAAGVHAVHTAQSNFTRCTARFDGAACNADVVEAFIESVLVYKECAGVSDDHALRGLPMLLTGDAAVWWRGVRPTVESWDDALRRLRFMYGARAQPTGSYATYSRQNNKCMACYTVESANGIANSRPNLRPHNVHASVDCLLERARYVEEMLGEANQCSTSSHNNNTANTNLRDKDNPSNATGKNINPQTAAVKNVNPQTTTSDSSSNIDSSSATSKRVRPRCARCKRFGHTTDECKSKGNELACYGCGREGVIRSKCPTCKGKCKEDAPAAAADGKIRQRAPADVRDNQLKDPELKTIVEDLEDSDPSRGRGWSERGYLMSDGVLYRLSTALLDARDVHEQAQSIRKKYADEGRRTPPDYKVGDLVLLKTQSMNDAGRGQTAKFIPRRDGPYRIREVVSPTTYVIEGLTRAEHIGRYHVSHLTPFVGDIVSPVREKRKRGRPRKLDASPNARALCPN
ncbi:hypothetical protein SFRURICE_001658 [Spodoptera frugiperda]|nr:hypothetical protein SFRURICE_001658 [Spodoptera frugiperda]